MKNRFLIYLVILLAIGLIFAPTTLIAQEPSRGGETEIEDESDDGTASSEVRLRFINRRLERVQERVNNESLRGEIQERVQNQAEATERIQNALEKIEGRPAYLRFLIGPDYKNAGELRSQIVRLRNEIRQLTNLKERLSGTEAEEVQTTIDELETESNTLETNLQEKLTGFSLFGWLARLFVKSGE